MAASRLKQVASFCCRIRSLAWANAASAVRYGSVSWHAVEVNIGDQEDLPRPPMRTSARSVYGVVPAGREAMAAIAGQAWPSALLYSRAVRTWLLDPLTPRT